VSGAPVIDERRSPPEASARGAPRWRDRLGPAELLFVGRGAPRRGERLAPELLPAGVETAWLEQVHSARLLETSEAGPAGAGDGLLIGRPGLAAVVAAADCVPVLLAAADRVAAVHAGWRGLADGIVARAVERLAPHWAWIGPAIGPCCYEVGEEVAAAVVAASAPEVRRAGATGRPHLDLAGAAARQLAAARGAGIREIRVLRHCTRCRGEWLESHRRDRERAGRNLAAIWLPLDAAHP